MAKQPASIKVRLHLLVSAKLIEEQTLVGELESRLKNARLRCADFQELHQSTSNGTCIECKGWGQVWVSYTQDDTKKQMYVSCNGTGEQVAP